MYEQRVKMGAALLDRVRPGWAAEIACDELAMASCDQCVLGQLYGGYGTGWFALTRVLPSHKLFSAADHGFTLLMNEQADVTIEKGYEAVMVRFADLADAWRAEVRARTVAAEV